MSTLEDRIREETWDLFRKYTPQPYTYSEGEWIISICLRDAHENCWPYELEPLELAQLRKSLFEQLRY